MNTYSQHVKYIIFILFSEPLKARHEKIHVAWQPKYLPKLYLVD